MNTGYLKEQGFFTDLTMWLCGFLGNLSDLGAMASQSHMGNE